MAYGVVWPRVHPHETARNPDLSSHILGPLPGLRRNGRVYNPAGWTITLGEDWEIITM